MAGNTLDLNDILSPDTIGCSIASKFQEWDMLKAKRKTAWREIQEYIYSTDTTTTSNSKLPWKNKTTLPKLCQIRDNLYANYVASLFPKSDLFEWEGADQSEQVKEKTEIMESVAEYLVNNPTNKQALYNVVLDFIDYGNGFAMKEWCDNTVNTTTGTSSGYIGPRIVRINPYDIVFNPIASSFEDTPKIVRSLMTIGELKKLIESNSIGDNYEEVNKAFEYLRGIRNTMSQYSGSNFEKNVLYAIDGFTSFDIYLQSSYVELLTFYGDYYDVEADKFYQNYIITIADRHKVVGMRQNPSYTGRTIHHIGWRPRQDNIWAMGPLENLVGMQYRIDHIENLKADVFDLIAAPPLMVKGLVEDFVWGPFARIYVGDDGDVKPLAPDGNVLSANLEINNLEGKMEEYAGSPKEAAGFRTPGEKTAYEVQRLENAANRIFYSKTKQFEEIFLEPLINDCIELLRRKMDSRITTRVFDEETNATRFLAIKQEDLAGVGRIKPVAARNFADKAEKVQNVNNFFSSVLGQDPEIKAHFSTTALARMFEELLDIESYAVVKPYVRLSEQQEAQSLMNAGNEQVAVEAGTPAGIAPDDFTGP